MTYLEWNTVLANHFFNESASGKKVFLCVTRDILAEVSRMSPETALADFIEAIKSGPDWTQTSGCTSIASKAMNCLLPDPHWKHRYHPKKRSLDGHIEWRTYLGETTQPPPYLAYLACFVLAWTERPADFNGNDYYGPLNQMLGLAGDAKIGTLDFGPYYSLYRACTKEMVAGQAWPRDAWGVVSSIRESSGRVELQLQNENKLIDAQGQPVSPAFCISLEDSEARHPAIQGLQPGHTIEIYDFLKTRSGLIAQDGPRTCVYRTSNQNTSQH
jgi:hypothetical protein